jgi:hypothetical protein
MESTSPRKEFVNTTEWESPQFNSPIHFWPNSSMLEHWCCKISLLCMGKMVPHYIERNNIFEVKASLECNCIAYHISLKGLNTFL